MMRQNYLFHKYKNKKIDSVFRKKQNDEKQQIKSIWETIDLIRMLQRNGRKNVMRF